MVGGQINREVIRSSSSASSAVTMDIRYYYDAAGRPVAIRLFDENHPDGIVYYLQTNLQGDVVGIYNASGTEIYEYAYDAWGNIIKSSQVATGGSDAHAVNPFRYRGYYYDTETGLYYLQSRYYNPEWGRFLNVDAYVNASGDLIGYNMYAYCNNNSINYVDISGEFPISLLALAVVGVVALLLPSCSSSTDYTVSDTATYYDVPCYDQGSTNLCGLYSQVMIESFDDGVELTQKEADLRVKELQEEQLGYYDPQHGCNPLNASTQLLPQNIGQLKNYLANGPIYAYYRDEFSNSHMVVVCGVDVEKELVYTRNPSYGSKGVQNFGDFMAGPTTKQSKTEKGWKLYCVWDVNR